MKYPQFYLSVLALPFVWVSNVTAQNTCHIKISDTPHQEIIKEILKQTILPSQEFTTLEFTFTNESPNDIDLIFDKKSTGAPFEMIPRAHFQRDYPLSYKKLENLQGQLTDVILAHLSDLMKERKKTAKAVAEIFMGSLNWSRLEENRPAEVIAESSPSKKTPPAPSLRIWKMAAEQLWLIFLPLLLALLVGVPLGKSFYKNEFTKSFLVSLTSIFLTIPPIALLCLFIPSYGMGKTATLLTLFIYNILVVIKFVAHHPEIPNGRRFEILRSSLFISKLKKLAITNVSLSTLAAFLGVGGFGSLIALGLALNDIPLTLKGAMGAAFLAMAVKWAFEAWEWFLTRQR